MSENTFEGPAVKPLQRSRSDRMLAGVSGGLASYFEIHPAFFRVGFVVLTLLGGAGLVIYFAAALVMPDEGKQDSIVSAALRDRRDRPWPLIGARPARRRRRCPPLARDAVAARRRLVPVPARRRARSSGSRGTRKPTPSRRRRPTPLLAPGPTRGACAACSRASLIAIASLVALVLIAAAIFAVDRSTSTSAAASATGRTTSRARKTSATSTGSASAT